jgi:hypothetical protein
MRWVLLARDWPATRRARVAVTETDQTVKRANHPTSKSLNRPLTRANHIATTVRRSPPGV